jgi:hypothetical protein
VLTTDDAGNTNVNVATGDQESITYSANLQNYVYSIRDDRDASFNPKAKTLWYKQLLNERVTGPMTVFDRVLYFATYVPKRPSGTGSAACDGLGLANLWGLDYVTPDSGGINAGGAKHWCPDGKVSGTSCTVAFVDKEAAGSDLIPGVALTQSLSCVVQNGGTDEYGNMAFSSMSSTTYTLSFGIANSAGAGKQTQAARDNRVRQLPTIATQISSWSLVLE